MATHICRSIAGMVANVVHHVQQLPQRLRRIRRLRSQSQSLRPAGQLRLQQLQSVSDGVLDKRELAAQADSSCALRS